jgi:hypothetical protein
MASIVINRQRIQPAGLCSTILSCELWCIGLHATSSFCETLVSGSYGRCARDQTFLCTQPHTYHCFSIHTSGLPYHPSFQTSNTQYPARLSVCAVTAHCPSGWLTAPRPSSNLALSAISWPCYQFNLCLYSQLKNLQSAFISRTRILMFYVSNLSPVSLSGNLSGIALAGRP